MIYVLVNWSDNWSDEMDLEGFTLMSKVEWESVVANTATYFKDNGSYEAGFGTNESNEYESFDRWLENFKTVELSEEEALQLAATLTRCGFTGSYKWEPFKALISYGFFPVPEKEEE